METATARGTIRQVHQIPGGGWRIALRDEDEKMKDYRWFKTEHPWVASLCDRFSAPSQRPLVRVTFDPSTFPGTLMQVEKV